MAKKETEIENKSQLFEMSVEEVMHTSMMPYSEYVILDRAIPRVEDGLKPVQRRILYAMYELGNTPDKPHKKSARIVGECLGKFHPHGDTSVYDAMVRMAQPFNMREVLIDGHGNFGSIDGDGAAAMRYTEARLNPLAMEILKDLEKDTVPWQWNFDDTMKEPVLLPCRFPNLLVNGANGIAVGFSTNIPTHNIGEIIDGAVAVVDNPKIKLDELMKIVPGPDFSTGGIIIAGETLCRRTRRARAKSLCARESTSKTANTKRKISLFRNCRIRLKKPTCCKKYCNFAKRKKTYSAVFRTLWTSLTETVCAP